MGEKALPARAGVRVSGLSVPGGAESALVEPVPDQKVLVHGVRGDAGRIVCKLVTTEASGFHALGAGCPLRVPRSAWESPWDAMIPVGDRGVCDLLQLDLRASPPWAGLGGKGGRARHALSASEKDADNTLSGVAEQVL